MINDPTQSDQWSEWLLHRRHGDSSERASAIRPIIHRYADHVLNAARLTENMTLVDIGSGDGLVAFEAIARIGPSLRVILTDVSAAILSHTEAVARQRGVATQCTFLTCSAEDLTAIPDASVDVVATRSVLAYVANKKKALQEFHRILKPGGRISLAEPIFRDDAFQIIAMKKWLDDHADCPDQRLLRLINQWKHAQLPATMETIASNPLINYSERDLFTMAKESRFTEVCVDLQLKSTLSLAMPWNVYIECSPHPLAPTLKEIMEHQFSAQDREFFEQAVRPTIESGQMEEVERMAYLAAVKPL
ncbi:arsenite methyltransferase [Oxalobacteraceae bacterium GrIS 2.11]